MLLVATGLVGGSVPDANAAGSDEWGYAFSAQDVFFFAKAGETITLSGEFKDKAVGWEPYAPDRARITYRRPGDGSATSCVDLVWDGSGNVRDDCSFAAPVTGVYLATFRTTRDGVTLTRSEASQAIDWDVTIKAGGTEQHGRAWTLDLNLIQDLAHPAPGLTVPGDFVFWALSEYGALYKVTYKGMYGVKARVGVDNVGVAWAAAGNGHLACESAYGSEEASGSSGSITIAMLANSPCKDDTTIVTRYRMFPENPLSVFASGSNIADLAALNGGKGLEAWNQPWAGGDTWGKWLYPKWQNHLPDWDLTASPASETAPTWAGTKVTISKVSQPAQLSLWVDWNGNDAYDPTADHKIATVKVYPDRTTHVTWDGKGPDGTIVNRSSARAGARGIRIFGLLDRAGEIHFLNEDTEELEGGIIAQQLVGDAVGTAAAYNLYWDDSRLTYWDGHGGCVNNGWSSSLPTLPCGSSVPPRFSGGTTADLTPANSQSGVSGWNMDAATYDSAGHPSYGDSRYIDRWTWIADRNTVVMATRLEPEEPPEVSVTKDDGRTVVVGEDELTYRIVATGDPTAEVPDAIVKDHLPPDLVFIAAPAGAGHPAGVYDAPTHSVTWSPVDLPAGGSRTLELGVRVRTDVQRGDESHANGRHEFTNYVTIDSNHPEDHPRPPADPSQGCPAPLCDQDTDHTLPPELRVEKTDDVQVVEPGQRFSYTITASNQGESDEPQATVTDVLPPQMTFVEASDGGAEADGVVTWTGIALAAGASKELSLTVEVDAGVPRPVTLDNLVTIRPNPESPDPECEPVPAPERDSWTNEDGTCAWHRDRTEPADLKILKELAEATVASDGSVSWLVTVGNDGPARARDVRVTDQLPPQVDPESVVWGSPSKGEVTDGVWLVGELAVGETATSLLTGSVADPTLIPADGMVNTVRATSPDDPGKGDPAAPGCQDNETLEADTDGCDLVPLYPAVPALLPEEPLRIETGLPSDTSLPARAGIGLLGLALVMTAGMGVAALRRRGV